MDEIEGTRTSVAIVTNSPPDEIPPTGSTRKAFVTCDGRASFDSSVVLSTVASFLREKVREHFLSNYPVRCMYCRAVAQSVYDGSITVQIGS